MSKTNITNVLDFISKEFNENRLRSAEIIANPEDHSQVILTYDIPVTDVEYHNRTTKPDMGPIEIEIEHDDARNAVLYLAENWNKIMHRNPLIIAHGTIIIGHAAIARRFQDDPYTEMHYIAESRNDATSRPILS